LCRKGKISFVVEVNTGRKSAETQPKHSRGKEMKRTEIQRGEGYCQRSKGIVWTSQAPGLRRKTAGGLLAGSKEG
jgi:hypothetical protein